MTAKLENIALNLHACIGESCYCRPGNEHLWKWTDADKERLRVAIENMVKDEEQNS